MLFYLLSAMGLVPTFQKTKCKKLLNITMERIKLLEKRRQVRVRQLHKDVIELLQLKKEHKVDPLLLRIWKELCLFFVYAKTAEYCEFVQTNLKDIAGQRECPSGLEEPLAGLCFAASCCADLPELQELREIFVMKYGKQIVSSGQDLTPNCHVNQQYLDCLYAKDPSEARKQALLEEIVAKHNAPQVHELCDSLSTEGSVDANECSQSKEGIEYAVQVSEVQHQSESAESQDFVAVQDPNLIEMVRQEDLGSKEMSNELVNRKRTLEDRATHCSAFKRAYRRTKLGLSEQPSCSQPPQRPPPPPSLPPNRAPPPPPPKRAPPPPPSLQVISMPSCRNDKQVNASASLSGRCSAMANDYSLNTHESHVHPRLPKYEDLVANFTALKR